MNSLKVILWNREIGRLVLDSQTRQIYFTFNPSEFGNIPDIAPLLAPIGKIDPLLPIYGDDRPQYQGLPPFIADSLPDAWGNSLFDRWVRDNKIPRNSVTPLYKLMFIGRRGMGALEFEPATDELSNVRKIDIASLYALSRDVLERRESVIISPEQALTMQALLSVESSAGGRQMKAIIAIDRESGEIRSGQTCGLKGYDYYILKFGDSSMPTAEIEQTYYAMAVDAGIDMEESRLLRIDGVSHFLTRRFDRRADKKIYTQTLAAIYPEARSYEDLVAVCRELSLKESEISQVFRRMVFNVMANNTDDHNRNFSFLMHDNGQWMLAPAYDVTFIFNAYGTEPNMEHRFSISGKTSGLTKSDLLDFARENGIRKASQIIGEVAKALSNFELYARRYGVTRPWADIINSSINNTLLQFGYKEHKESENEPISIDGHMLRSIDISVNTDGNYDVKASIDDIPRRRVIRSAMPEYSALQTFDIYNLSKQQKIEIVELLFIQDPK